MLIPLDSSQGLGFQLGPGGQQLQTPHRTQTYQNLAPRTFFLRFSIWRSQRQIKYNKETSYFFFSSTSKIFIGPTFHYIISPFSPVRAVTLPVKGTDTMDGNGKNPVQGSVLGCSVVDKDRSAQSEHLNWKNFMAETCLTFCSSIT